MIGTCTENTRGVAAELTRARKIPEVWQRLRMGMRKKPAVWQRLRMGVRKKPEVWQS